MCNLLLSAGIQIQAFWKIMNTHPLTLEEPCSAAHLCSLLSCNAFIHHDWRHIFNVRAKTRTHVHLYVYVCKCTGLGGGRGLVDFKKITLSCILYHEVYQRQVYRQLRLQHLAPVQESSHILWITMTTDVIKKLKKKVAT